MNTRKLVYVCVKFFTRFCCKRYRGARLQCCNVLHIHFTITNTFLIGFDLLHTDLLVIYADYKFIKILRKESIALQQLKLGNGLCVSWKLRFSSSALPLLIIDHYCDQLKYALSISKMVKTFASYYYIINCF